MKVTVGNDKIYFSYFKWLGLGVEKTVAIFYPASRVLEVTEGSEYKLGITLKALRKSGQMKEPIIVKYW